jgi:diadenylate cyclase
LVLAFYIGFLEVNWIDLLDIGLVGYLLFQLYKLVRNSVATRIFVGFLTIYLAYLLTRLAGMELLTSILEQFKNVGVIALLVLFQQEIRKSLLILGKTTIFDRDSVFRNLPWRRAAHVTHEGAIHLQAVFEAVKHMSSTHTGALIVFARNSDLKFYAESGDLIDATISKRLILSIFNKNSPMHDGAVIIRNNRIWAARCILPVSERQSIPAQFGLRHRAAVGLTELTDAIVLVASEETGQVSLVKDGELFHNLSPQELRNKLADFMLGKEDAKGTEASTDLREPLQDRRSRQVEA